MLVNSFRYEDDMALVGRMLNGILATAAMSLRFRHQSAYHDHAAVW